MKIQKLLSSLLVCLLFLLASFVGATARVSIQEAVAHGEYAFFVGVFVVNCLGCFLFGFIWAAYPNKDLRIGLTGFMGSFTTFSTLMADCYILINSAAFPLLLVNLIGQIALGLMLLRLGIFCGQSMKRTEQAL